MNKLAIFIISCLLLTQSVFSSDGELFSFIPPVPQNRPDFSASVRKPFVDGYKHMSVILEIDKKGRVKSVKPEIKADTLYAEFVSDYLRSFEFSPALKEGKKVKSVLPVLVHLSKKIAVPDVDFPLTEHASNANLLRYSYELNRILLPKIVSFPSYFTEISPTDSLLYKFQLYSLEIDKSGKLIGIEKVMSTNPSFDGQIESAMLYASFSPCLQKSKGKNSSCYMKISYFPTIQYPTFPYDSTHYENLSQLKQRRLEILPVSVKLLSEPLPKTIPDHLYPISNIQYAVHSAVEAYVHIDTLGKISLMRTDAKVKDEKESVRRICKNLRLYPALDINGNPVDFYGYLRFERFEQNYIRISYLWLK
ncbi:MAG: hypothetical protein DWP97_12820 [Calditrichaeota bacterium]|nr:MAG: hypothetical protein DWP97_12820 [Calditrichota bacterium]